jgi:hypothetical protein
LFVCLFVYLLLQSNFFKGFREELPSLFVSSLSKPIAVQVTPMQVNVINRYTGTLLSEWHAPPMSNIPPTDSPITKALMVCEYLCIIQSNNRIFLLSCETPSTSGTNNRIRKIFLQQESSKSFSDEIRCVDSFPLPSSESPLESKPSKDCTSPPSEPAPKPASEPGPESQKEDHSSGSSKDDSMADIWENIMEESVGSLVGSSFPSLEPSLPSISSESIQGYLVAYMSNSHTVQLLAVPSLQTVCSVTLSETTPKACSVVMYANRKNSFKSFRVLLGLENGNVLGLSVNTEQYKFQPESLTELHLSGNSSLPAKLFKLSVFDSHLSSTNSLPNTQALILVSTNALYALECFDNDTSR